MEMSKTIVALSTAAGHSAIAVIRLSGREAIVICDAVFIGHKLVDQPSHTVHFGKLAIGDKVLDEVVVTIFKAPYSFTKENVVEISCHGSPFIVQQIIELLISQGAVPAKAGEFTMRAFLNGRFDLSQAEAVADLIASENESTHKMAIQQMRGGFSERIKLMRQQLVHLASLLELELDFSEEDVEFANRDQLSTLLEEIIVEASHLRDSFRWGNVLKNGISTVIAGKPNAGKSTLLNLLLNEERAIVSEIPGTTRDTIEEKIQLNGITFRFIDTAGLRDTNDVIEKIGVQRSMDKINDATVLLYLFDVKSSAEEVALELKSFSSVRHIIPVGTKTDLLLHENETEKFSRIENCLFISSVNHKGIAALKMRLIHAAENEKIQTGEVIVNNIRHVQSLNETIHALKETQTTLSDNLSKELIAQNIRFALHSLGEITGEITNDDLLANIFSKFCIGK